MPFKIQRVPRGLLDFLSISGGGNPVDLEDRVRAVIELTQFYGLQQMQTGLASNAAAAEGTLVPLVLSAQQWTVLFAACATVTHTGTMTALAFNVNLTRTGALAMPLAQYSDLATVATATGAVQAPWFAPYPLLCPPGSAVGATATIIGTDATASVTVRAEFGVLS